MGRRKKRGFGWSADPDDPQLRPEIERPNRAALKRHLEALEALVVEIAALSPPARRALPISQEILDELDTLAQCPPTPARKRQRNYVKRLMGQLDLAPIRAALAGQTPRADQLREVERWRDRLIEEGDAGLQELIEQHPQIDRQQIRALIRQAQRSKRSHRALFDALKEWIVA